MLSIVGVGAETPGWRQAAGHEEVIETLLTMAEAEHRWGDSPRALQLLDHVERIVGTLPDASNRLRSRCRRDAGLPTLA
jgi:hypothetical protein